MAWYVMQAPMAGALSYLHEFLMVEYERIFSVETMHRFDCTIYNDPNSPCPRCDYSNPARIRLHQQSLNLWAQTVYQLSHEMTHYACYSVRGRSNGAISWYEEVACEAMSLYALEYAAANWKSCWLSHINPRFDGTIRDYLNTVLADAPSSGLADCRTHAALLAYERARYPENRRAGHVRERNLLYHAIRKAPWAAGAIPYYCNFVCAGGVVIDFAAWRRANPTNPLIPVLASIQPAK